MFRQIKKLTSLSIIVTLLVSLILSSIPIKGFAAQQSTGGPIILMGIDAEDGGVGGHGPISVYQNIVSSILAKVTNGGSGILVFGANSYYVTDFWNNIASKTGQNVKFVPESDIDTISFIGYAMIVVSSDEHNTYGGFTQTQHNKLVNRQNDIASFINNGGGLLGFASDFSNPYAYLGAIANISASINLSYDDISPNAEGQAIGITDALDICCWHDTYSSYPGFLRELSKSPSGSPSVIGGLNISVPSKLTAEPSVVSIAQGQQIPLKVTLDDGTNLQDVTATSTGTVYESNSPNVVVNSEGVIHLLPEVQKGDSAVITITNNNVSTTVTVKVDPTVTTVELLELNTSSAVLLGPGEKQQLKVNASYSDGTSKDVTYASKGTTYSSTVPDYINVSPNGMISIGDNAPYGGSGTITIKNQDKTVDVQVKISDPPTKIVANPASLTLKSGDTAQLKVLAEFSNGSQKDITKSVSYTSGNTGLAIVDNSGHISIPKTASDGSVTIKMTYAGLETNTVINVSYYKELTGIHITPDTITMKQGTNQSVNVIADYSDGSTADVTGATAFSSDNTSLATIDHGIVTVPDTAQGGTVKITGSFNGQIATAVVTVPSKPILNSLKFIPDSITLKKNDTLQLQVMGVYSDGTEKDVTPQVVYQSSNESLATVDASGLVRVDSNAAGGTVYIRGTYDGKGGASTITVPSLPPITGLTVTADKTTVGQGQTTKVTVMANYSDGSSADVTTEAGLNSSNTNMATVDPVTGIASVKDDAAGGTVYIRASYGGKGGAAALTIPNPPSVVSLSFTPDKIQLKQGESTQVRVTALLSDGTTKDITGQAGLNSSNTSQATVDASTGLVKILDSAARGTVYIRGSYGGKGGATTVTIPALPTVTGLTFTPTTKSVKPGDTIQIQLMANYSDGSTVDVTDKAMLKTSNSSLATVDSSTGLVTIPMTATSGNVNIQGSFGGKGGSSTITVNKPYLVGLAFNPASVNLKAGDTLSMQAVAIYSDGTTEDVTSQTVYSSSNTSIATVDASGKVQILNPTNGGTVYIRGAFNGKGAASTVTVPAPPTVTNFSFSPATATLRNGETLKVSATAEYSDGTSEDVTSKVSFSSSNVKMATVDNTGLITVLPTAPSGTVYIRGSFGGKGSVTTITIPTKPPLSGITFNPVKISLNKGTTFQVQVIANYSDGSSEDVTALTSFSSSNTNLATVNATGLITTAANSLGGTVYIRGSYSGKGSAVTVTIP